MGRAARHAYDPTRWPPLARIPSDRFRLDSLTSAYLPWEKPSRGPLVGSSASRRGGGMAAGHGTIPKMAEQSAGCDIIRCHLSRLMGERKMDRSRADRGSCGRTEEART